MKSLLPNFLIIFSIITLFLSCGNPPKNSGINNNMEVMYIGTYTKKEAHVNGQADGILTVYRNPQDGSLIMGETVAQVTNPSFVKISKDGNYLYAVSELGEKDAPSGFIFSYRIHEDNSLEVLSKLSTEAFAPCHINTDKTGEYIFVANYSGGVVMMYQKNADGTLKKKQKITLENPKQSHPHSVSISADNKHAYIADLGNDKIWIFDFDEEEGILTASQQAYIDLKNGAGPRHFTFSKNENFAYSINELNSSVSVFKVLENGGLENIQNISSLPQDFSGENSAADIHLHPSGKFLYVSNRGHNSIASYKINENFGELTLLEFTSTEGKTPRNFAIEPNGRFLYVANQDSNNIVSFRINEETGVLNLQAESLKVMTPVCIKL